MKYLFAIILLILLAATALNHISRPDVRSDKPILYWVTSTNEARQQQVKQFHQWIEDNGYPPMELRIDSSNRDISKKLIQGVSGVGADIIDMVRDEPWLLESTGMLEDLTELAAQHGFGPDKTWEAKYPSVIINGAQYRGVYKKRMLFCIFSCTNSVRQFILSAWLLKLLIVGTVEVKISLNLARRPTINSATAAMIVVNKAAKTPQ